MSNERDELARLIYEDDPWLGLGRDGLLSQPIDWAVLDEEDRGNFYPLADAILAAGYSKPRTVTTIEELDALPVGSVLMDRDSDICQRFRGGWRAVIAERVGDPWLTDTLEVDLPATVLHSPAASK